jgi:hypothetical protein
MTANELANLIVDALNDGGVLRDETFKLAVEIAEEEIVARVALGDVILMENIEG